MQHNYWIYLLIMFAVTYLVRVLPLVVFRKKITNRFVRSFLAYIPYAVLAAMTFPAVFLQWTAFLRLRPALLQRLLLHLKGEVCLP